MYNGIYNDSINKFYESVVWTHKIQRTYLEILEKRRKVISIIEVVFTSIAGIATALFAIFGNNIGTIVSSVCILASVILNAILEKVETKNDIEAFRKSSSTLWLLRCDVEKVALKAKANLISDEEAGAHLEMLQSTFNNAVCGLTTVPNKYVEIASYKIKERKDEEAELKLL